MRRIMFPVCCGIDVHKNKLSCCIVIAHQITDEPVYHFREFSCHQPDLVKLVNWLNKFNCHDVCMESTGKYWIPVFNHLENSGIHAIITHPKYVRSRDGKKTDHNDSSSIADAFQLGQAFPSFVPSKEWRQLRDLSRYRFKITCMIASEKNRVQNCQTMSNITLASVVSDPFGVSASDIFAELLTSSEVDETRIRSLLHGRLRKKHKEIMDSIQGYRLESDQSLKALLALNHIQYLDDIKDTVTKEMLNRLKPYQAFIKLACSMPGIGTDSSLTILSETGTDMSIFPSANHFASWIGLSPRSRESNNKKKSVRINHAGTYLKPLLVQCALAAIKSNKDPYFRIKYNKIKKRRGHKRAIIAIARMMAICLYHMFKTGEPFNPSDYEELRNPRPMKPEKDDLQAALELIRSTGQYTITSIEQAAQ